MKKFLRLPRWTYNSSGFTLIEISLVLCIIALLAILTTAHARLFDRLLVRAELERIYAIASYLQRSAMVRNQEVKLVFDPERRSYRYRKTEYYLPAHVEFGCPPTIQGPPSAPTAVIAQPITFKDNAIIFHPDGIVQSGTLYLTDKSKRYAYALSCSVSQVSYLRKYQYTNTWELL